MKNSNLSSKKSAVSLQAIFGQGLCSQDEKLFNNWIVYFYRSSLHNQQLNITFQRGKARVGSPSMASVVGNSTDWIHSSTTLQQITGSTNATLSPYHVANATSGQYHLFPDYYLLYHRVIKGLLVLVTLLAIPCNGFVLYLFAARKVRLTPFNIQLLQMTIVDLLANISIYPFISVGVELIPLRTMSQVNANIACSFIVGETPFWIATSVSILTLSFISFTRYLKIQRPTKYYWINGKKGTITILLMIWIPSMLPLKNFFSFVYDPRGFCNRVWPKGFDGMLYRRITATLTIVGPTSLLLFTFFSARRILLRRNKNISESDGGAKKLRNTVKLLGFLILVYFVSWSPYFSYWLLAGILPHKVMRKSYLEGYLITFGWLAGLCNSVANPIIYALKGEEFRKGIEDFRKKMTSQLRNVVIRLRALETTEDGLGSPAQSLVRSTGNGVTRTVTGHNL